MTSEQANHGMAVGLQRGAKVGKYEVTERLGVGGQAIVYKCYDSLLDRYVAVKQISTHLAADPKFLERFRKEAQILARLSSQQPAVVSIHELVEDERGLFIVMEYIEGHSLETVMNDTNGPTETKAALQIFWRLAAALNDVHKAGIIHRDLKPANILIAEGLRPKITDFGVAASISGQTSMLLGTTKYMAPELFGAGPVDGRVDMYSLGFIMYELLAGRPKFNEVFAEVVRDKHSEAMRWMKWHGNPEEKAPPLHELNEAVPAELSAIIARMLAKDPKDRFENMEALGKAIKMGFSPRGRAAAAAAVAEANLARKGRRARRAMAPAGAGPTGEEGDELEIPADQGPATAPIPKKKLSRRSKLILAGGISLVLVVAAVTLGVIASNVAREASNRAGKVYQNGAANYINGKYAEALDYFKKLQGDEYKGTPEAAKASVLMHFCLAQISLANAEKAELEGHDAQALWQQEASEENLAQERLKAVQAQAANQEQVKWTRDRDTDLRTFIGERVAIQDFAVRCGQAKAEFAAEKYENALTTLGLLADQSKLDPQRKAQILALRKEIQVRQFKVAFEKAVKDGDDKAAQNLFDAAKGSYEAAKNMLDSAENVPLTSEDRKAYETMLADKIKSAGISIEVAKFLAKAGELLAKNDKKGALDALTRASKLRTNLALDDRILTLRGEIAVDEGRKLVAEGKLKEARQQFELSNRLKQNDTATGLLAELDKSEKKTTVKAEGDELMTAGKLAEALKKYEEASQQGGVDNELAGKIADCRFQIEMTRADKLFTQRQFAEAVKASEEARAIKPAESARVDVFQARIKQQQDYENIRDQALEALHKGDFAKATELGIKARLVMETEEIKDFQNEVKYQENIAKGKESMRLGDEDIAIGYFNIATRYAKGAEEAAAINKLIEEAVAARNRKHGDSTK